MSTAIDPTFVANTLGVKTEFADLGGGSARFLPQRIAVLGIGNTASTYAADRVTLTGGAAEAASTYGFGSQIHLAVLRLLPVFGDGVGSIPVTVYPLVDGTTPATDQITPSGTITKTGVFYAILGGVRTQNFTVLEGASTADMVASVVAAINATLDVPHVAVDNLGATADLTAKWGGTVGNDIVTEIIGPSDTGAVWTIAGAASGAGNPTVDSALALFGDTWETFVVNCLGSADSTALGTLGTHNEGRWGALVRRPYVAATADPNVSKAALIVIGDAGKTDRTNSVRAYPGSNDLPFMMAARSVARMAVQAQLNPARDYVRQDVSDIRAGSNAVQYDANDRDQLVKAGIATTEIRDDGIVLSDSVTRYHPDGDPLPAYRFISSITRLQTIIFNLELIFDSVEWAGAPLVNDEAAVTESSARSPKAAKAAIGVMLGNLEEAAIIVDATQSRLDMTVLISGINNNRLDIVLPVKLSGNTFVKSVDLKFGFNFG